MYNVVLQNGVSFAVKRLGDGGQQRKNSLFPDTCLYVYVPKHYVHVVHNFSYDFTSMISYVALVMRRLSLHFLLQP